MIFALFSVIFGKKTRWFLDFPWEDHHRNRNNECGEEKLMNTNMNNQNNGDINGLKAMNNTANNYGIVSNGFSAISVNTNQSNTGAVNANN